MFCISCGVDNPDQANFCYRCGAAIHAPSERRVEPAAIGADRSSVPNELSVLQQGAAILPTSAADTIGAAVPHSFPGHRSAVLTIIGLSAVAVLDTCNGLILVFWGPAVHAALATNEANVESSLVGAIAVMRILVYIICAAAFVSWFYRAHSNLTQLAPHQKRYYSPRWAIGGFVIPFANLFVPYLIMKEIGQGSNPSSPVSRQLIAAWWVSFLATWIVFRVASSVTSSHVLFWEAAGYFLEAMAAGVAIRLVRVVDGRQTQAILASRHAAHR